MEKWLVPGLRQEIYKMSPEHLVVLESKEVLENKHTPPTLMGISQRGRSQLKELSMAKGGMI